MTSEKILYTDGHQVTVTNTFFQVKKDMYLLNGITKHGFLIIHPDRLPALLILIMGAMMLTLGALGLIPQKSIPYIELGSLYLGINTLSIMAGVFLVVVSVLVMGLVRERYAVRIATAEGEKNVVVSKSKAYISQIIEALNRAVISVVPSRRK